MSAPTRRQVGRWRLLNGIDNALRDAYPDPDHPTDPDAQVVDRTYCRRTVRPAPRGQVRVHGNPLRHALHDHPFSDCPAVEVAR